MSSAAWTRALDAAVDLSVAMNFGIHIEHACGGSCACTTCHVIMKSGDDNLSPADDDELDRLDMAPGLTLHSRLACQAIVPVMREQGSGSIVNISSIAAIAASVLSSLIGARGIP